MRISEMSDEKLMERYASLHNSIEVHDVYNTQDILEYELISQELEKRNIEVVSEVSFTRR